MTPVYVRWLWLLSGLPVSAILIVLPPSMLLWCFTFIVVLDTAHSFSPIVLAWTHNGFRRTVIYAKPAKYIFLPCGIFLLALIIGAATQIGLTSWTPSMGLIRAPSQLLKSQNPFWLLVAIYSGWNLYHFSMQNFGVTRLCKVPLSRTTSIIVSFGGMAALVFVLPYFFRSAWMSMVTLGVVSINHWVVDIGISSRASRHGWVFVVAVLALGTVGFLWIVPTPGGLMLRMAMPALICVRLGLGLVHFLYSRWVWRLSDPLVRATIGRDLFPRTI